MRQLTNHQRSGSAEGFASVTRHSAGLAGATSRAGGAGGVSSIQVRGGGSAEVANAPDASVPARLSRLAKTEPARKRIVPGAAPRCRTAATWLTISLAVYALADPSATR